jgi:hypothetical protein
MAGPTYRVKLYGHVNPDADRFVTQLAVLLGVTEADARALLAKAPVVVREGMDRAAAQAFHESLNLIRALAILEAERPPGATELAGFPDEGHETGEGGGTELPLSKRISGFQLILIAALAALIALIGAMAVVSPFKAMKQGKPYRALESPMGPERTPSPYVYEGFSVKELNAMWHQLDAENKELATELQDVHKKSVESANAYGTPQEQVDATYRRLAELRLRISKNQREKDALMRRIRALEYFGLGQEAQPERSEDMTSGPGAERDAVPNR